MQIIIELLLLLGISLIIGEIFERLGFPGIVGNIIAGLMLGPAIFGIIAPNPELNAIAEIALFFIILLIGIEVTTDLITKNVGRYSLFTITGFALPSIMIALIFIYVFHFGAVSSTITAIAVGIPSISIISVLVLKYKLLKYQDGSIIIASTVASDIIAFSALAILSNKGNAMLIIISLALVFIALFAIDSLIKRHAFYIRRFFNRMSLSNSGERITFGLIIVAGLIFASVFQLIGITYVLGAFFAGMLIYDTIMGKRFYNRVSRTFKRINYSFFIPLFFSIAGLSAIFPKGTYLEMLVIALASIGLFSLVTFLLGKRIFKKIMASTGTGIIGSRGAVGVTIGSVAFTSGLITANLYSIVIFGTIVLSLIMPLLISKKDKRDIKKLTDY
ncbi:cation:proton antiporter [Candidatus Marsarchaeota archaeon]|jgi:Kef-type K+ transport system membrane component KefB|nr:cation:proton antiporter [Candidatus Marsarchaeota archaeon]MCL5092640.1 cation:proton antiporter [Candidatus Marsarchaeota archaeon]